MLLLRIENRLDKILDSTRLDSTLLDFCMQHVFMASKAAEQWAPTGRPWGAGGGINLWPSKASLSIDHFSFVRSILPPKVC